MLLLKHPRPLAEDSPSDFVWGARDQQGGYRGQNLHQELRDAAAEDRKRRQAERARQADGERSNLGLGHDITAKLIDPTDSQLQALKTIVCHLIAGHYREVIAYGAGWSDRDRQQPVGDTGRYEPRHPNAILDAELGRALDERAIVVVAKQLPARSASRLMLLRGCEPSAAFARVRPSDA